MTAVSVKKMPSFLLDSIHFELFIKKNFKQLLFLENMKIEEDLQRPSNVYNCM